MINKISMLEFVLRVLKEFGVFQKSRKNKTDSRTMGCEWCRLQGYSQFFNSSEKGASVNPQGSGRRISIVVVPGKCVDNQLGLGGFYRVVILFTYRINGLG